MKGNFVQSIINYFKALSVDLAITTGMTTGLTKAFAILKTVLATLSTTAKIALGILAGSFIIGGIIKLVDKQTVSYEEQVKIVNELESKLSSLQSEYDSLSSSMTATDGDKLKLAVLEAQIRANEILLAQEKEKELSKYIEETYKPEKQRNITASRQISYTTTKTSEEVYATDITDSISAVEKYNETLTTADANLEKLQEQLGAGIITQESYNVTMASMGEAYDTANTARAEEIAFLATEFNRLQDIVDTGGDLTDVQEGVYNSLLENIGIFTDYTDAQEDSNKASEDAISKAEEVAEAFANAKDELFSMGDAFETLNSVTEEYNSTGKLSLDSLESLLALDTEYLSLLEFENGQLVVNAENSQILAQAKIDTAKATAIASAQEAILALMTAEANGELNNNGTATSTASVNMQIIGTAFAEAGTQAYIAGEKFREAYEKATGEESAGFSDEFKIELEKIASGLETQLLMIDSVGTSLGSYSSSSGGASSATDELTEALERQEQALEDVSDALEKQIDDYETVIDYAQSMIDKEIEALEEQSDFFEDVIDYRIELLEREAEKAEEVSEREISALEAQIEAIEEENDAVEESIALQELQEALAQAKARKAMVLKDGQYTYVSDESAVAEAQLNLDEYNREQEEKAKIEALEAEIDRLETQAENTSSSYDTQIGNLEDYKDSNNSIYGQQIYALEETVRSINDKYNQSIADLDENNFASKALYNEAVNALNEERYAKLAIYEAQLDDLYAVFDKTEGSYEGQIEDLEGYSEQLETILNESAEKQAEALYNQYIGEQENWDMRLEALSAFVSEYQQKMAQLEILQGYDSSSGVSSEDFIKAQMAQNSANWATASDSEKIALAEQNQILGASIGATYNSASGKWTYLAKGDYSIDEDKMAFVGDAPYTEAVIGAKYNKSMGVPMKLQQGTGVLTASETASLTSLISGFVSGNNYSTNNNNKSTSFSIGNISFPNVTDSNDIIDLFSNFETRMIQKAYT